MLQALIGPVANLVGGFLNNADEQAQAKHQAKLQVIQNDADWERDKMAAAHKSMFVAGRTNLWTGIAAVPLCLGYSVVGHDPAILQRVSTVFLLWIICQIGISIYYFLQYLRHLESVVLIS